MKYNIKIHRGSNIDEYTVNGGTNLLEFLRSESFLVDTPCAGKGSCGKCGIKVIGIMANPSESEKQLLAERLESGIRLACYNSIDADLDIYEDGADDETYSIITEGKRRNIKLEPSISKRYVEMPEPDLTDQTPDLERVLRHSDSAASATDVLFLQQLPNILRTSDFKATVVKDGDKLIAVEPGNTSGVLLGAAFDIGTTTVAAYLYDLNTGICLDVYSTTNPQRKYGADVITRIGYTEESENARTEMHVAIIECINSIIRHFSGRLGIKTTDIYETVFVGNTTMVHFLLGLEARNMAVSPFIPATTGMLKLNASSLGIKVNNCSRAVILPSVSAYVGADTVAAVLSSGMYEADEISLLIDIGTNGEIVIGNRERLLACSAAAGPAFEGANIRNGVGGINGAIDSVRLIPEYRVTTIGDAKPVGICGSGIVDAVSQMLLAGIIDETGRIAGNSVSVAAGALYRDRIVEVQGEKAFLLVPREACAANTEIVITQKDIRELQNAKAAIAAGILTLIRHAGLEVDDIRKVYLAGGFGSRINIESAIGIGLIPRKFLHRIESIGNAAGSGAAEGLLSAGMLEESVRIKSRIEYFELSVMQSFSDEYINCMTFEND